MKIKKIVDKLAKSAASRRWIVKYNGENVFDYASFTNHCMVVASENHMNAEDIGAGIMLRDMSLEQADASFNRTKAYKFNGLDCID